MVHRYLWFPRHTLIVLGIALGFSLFAIPLANAQLFRPTFPVRFRGGGGAGGATGGNMQGGNMQGGNIQGGNIQGGGIGGIGGQIGGIGGQIGGIGGGLGGIGGLRGRGRGRGLRNGLG
ncbi:MAG: hypothetical protein ACFCD0_02850, partial [Gemmataceae bacterium]